MARTEIDGLLYDEREHLNKLHDIVNETIKGEKLIVFNLLNPPSEILSRGSVFLIRSHASVEAGGLLYYLGLYLPCG